MRASVLLGGLTGLALLGLAGSAFAQSNPSSDDIIRSLRPGAGFSGSTRGIRPTMQAPDAAPAASVVLPAVQRTGGPALTSHYPAVVSPALAGTAAAAPSVNLPSVNLNVQFATGSAELTPSAVRTLNDLGRALASPALTGSHFRIEGHTDTVGLPEANKELSARRAATVVSYLVEHFHLAADRLDSVGMGDEGLLIQTPPQHGEPRNRRVQVVNTGA